MNLKGFLANLNAEKLSLNTLSGFVAFLAVLLTFDALTPSHVIQSVLAETDAGPIVMATLFVIAVSAILGLMVDSVFHTFGRKLARWAWQPLDDALNNRETLMKSIGLTLADFEWVKALGSNIAADENTRLMRFTETAGNTAYSLLLLAPAAGLYFAAEYAVATAWILAGLTLVAALVLIYTSAAALGKYESRKTAAAMDEIAKLSSQRLKADRHDRPFWPFFWKSLYLVIPVIIMCGISAAVIVTTPGVAKESGMKIISEMTGDKVPTLEITVDKAGTPIDVSKSMTVKIRGSYQSLSLVANEGVLDSVAPEGPKWQVKAVVSNGDTSADISVSDGEFVLVNALVSFAGGNGRLQVGDIGEGDWLFPVVMKAGQEKFLLAYIKVIINPKVVPAAESAEAKPAAASGNATKKE